jgi:hypothetical protein
MPCRVKSTLYIQESRRTYFFLVKRKFNKLHKRIGSRLSRYALPKCVLRVTYLLGFLIVDSSRRNCITREPDVYTRPYTNEAKLDCSAGKEGEEGHLPVGGGNP